ncbi:hypothetical protein BDB01DRAFT_188035 [Pilobolus umbonatus]|nr:hypothetical protein BDB01DRAFT_188035 [Pilobolus umbonatus]
MLKNHIAAYSKKHMQEQVTRLTNEIEELQLEKEENRRNVIHFMQDADKSRRELKKAQELIEEITARQVGFISPPPEEQEEQEEPKNGANIKKVSTLMSRFVLLDEQKIDSLFRLLEDDEDIEHLTEQLDRANATIMQCKSDILSLSEELEQKNKEKDAIRLALGIENERADTIERRWRENEYELEKSESLIQSLTKEVEKLRLLQLTPIQPQPSNKEKEEIQSLKQQLSSLQEKYTLSENSIQQLQFTTEQLQSSLHQSETTSAEIKGKYECVVKQLNKQENQEIQLEQARMREGQLKIISKTLRDELRKAARPHVEPLNLEYLRNVVLKFIENKETRADMIPILCNLLQCSKEDQTRLHKSVITTKRKKNNIIIPSFTHS